MKRKTPDGYYSRVPLLTPLYAALLVLALVLGLTACEPGEGGWQGPHTPEAAKPHEMRHTGLIGDSLIDGHDEEWIADPYVQTGGPIKMWTIGATKVPSALTWLGQSDQDLDVLIIAHGTNNARDGWDQADIDAYDSYLAEADDIPCVVMVNLGFANQAAASYKTGVNEANAYFAARVLTPAPGQTRKVVNWRGWSSYAPTWYAEDGIHHSATGATKYKELTFGMAKTCPVTWGA